MDRPTSTPDPGVSGPKGSGRRPGNPVIGPMLLRLIGLDGRLDGRPCGPKRRAARARR
jgi:hypothetical protein